jgi:hypothetical protein
MRWWCPLGTRPRHLVGFLQCYLTEATFPQVDMSPQFPANQYLFLLLDTVCLSGEAAKYQIYKLWLWHIRVYILLQFWMYCITMLSKYTDRNKISTWTKCIALVGEIGDQHGLFVLRWPLLFNQFFLILVYYLF